MFVCVKNSLGPFQQGRRRAKSFYSEAVLRAELHCDALPADPKQPRMTLSASFLPVFALCRRVVVVNEAKGKPQRHNDTTRFKKQDRQGVPRIRPKPATDGAFAFVTTGICVVSLCGRGKRSQGRTTTPCLTAVKITPIRKNERFAVPN